MLMATAWLGDDRVVVQMEQDVVEGGDLGPVGRFGLCASSWRAAIAAWSWYGPMGPRGRAAVTSAIPSSAALRSRRLRSCSAMGMSDPSGPDFIRDITQVSSPGSTGCATGARSDRRGGVHGAADLPEHRAPRLSSLAQSRPSPLKR
jgi:hypothetical protein